MLGKAKVYRKKECKDFKYPKNYISTKILPILQYLPDLLFPSIAICGLLSIELIK